MAAQKTMLTYFKTKRGEKRKRNEKDEVNKKFKVSEEQSNDVGIAAPIEVDQK